LYKTGACVLVATLPEQYLLCNYAALDTTPIAT